MRKAQKLRKLASIACVVERGSPSGGSLPELFEHMRTVERIGENERERESQRVERKVKFLRI